MPDSLHRLTAWLRRLVSSVGAWFVGDEPAQPAQKSTAVPSVRAPGAVDVASQPWQASAQANGFTTPPPDRQSPIAPARQLTGGAFTGAPDITPQLTTCNPQAATPFTPRSLAAHISRPLSSRVDSQFDSQFDSRPEARSGFPAGFTPPNAPLTGQGNLGAPSAPPYQTSGPNDDTLPPRASGLAGIPNPPEMTDGSALPSLSDLDAPTLPSLNLPARSGSAETTPGAQSAQPTQSGQVSPDGNDLVLSHPPFTQAAHDDAATHADDEAEDGGDDAAPDDPLAADDALARALAGRAEPLSDFDAPDGSPVTRRRMIFLRYLVRRRVYNEGFAPGEAPPQYHHSLGLDDDGSDDTLPDV